MYSCTVIYFNTPWLKEEIRLKQNKYVPYRSSKVSMNYLCTVQKILIEETVSERKSGDVCESIKAEDRRELTQHGDFPGGEGGHYLYSDGQTLPYVLPWYIPKHTLWTVMI
jgi:hypothetical protein